MRGADKEQASFRSSNQSFIVQKFNRSWEYHQHHGIEKSKKFEGGGFCFQLHEGTVAFKQLRKNAADSKRRVHMQI